MDCIHLHIILPFNLQILDRSSQLRPVVEQSSMEMIELRLGRNNDCPAIQDGSARGIAELVGATKGRTIFGVEGLPCDEANDLGRKAGEEI